MARDLRRCLSLAKMFRRRHHGKVAKLARSPQRLLTALRAFEKIQAELDRSSSYAFLVFAADSTEPAHGALLQRVREQGTAVEQELLFFDLELGRLPVTLLHRLNRHPALAPYHHFLKQEFAWRSHQLSEVEERLFADMNVTGSAAFVRLFDEEQAAKRFRLGRREVTVTELGTRLQHPGRAVRRAALLALHAGLKPEARRLTFFTNTLAAAKATRDRYRHFAKPEDSRHLRNELDRSVVELVSAVVARHYPLVQDYYHFKAKMLGTKKLVDYDMSAPLGRARTRIPFTEAKQIVLEAFANFSPEYATAAQRFFDKNWIDATPRPGKRGGAFCASTTPNHHPYILTSYHGTLRDVTTLAHELGHGVHGLLANKHSLFDFQAPLPLAETASVFGELLVFEALRRRLKNRAERLALYATTVESAFATVFRQIAMYRFEQDLHRARRRQGELSTATITGLWRRRQHELAGQTIEPTPGTTGLGWTTIPHFIHSPFYVYSYAIGQLLTLSLYQRYREEGQSFVPKYLDLLRSGGSRSPQELLQPLGINLADKKFWEGGITLIRQLVTETKQLALRPAQGKPKTRA